MRLLAVAMASLESYELDLSESYYESYSHTILNNK